MLYNNSFNKKLRGESGEKQSYLDGYEKLVIPAINKAGRAEWGSRFPLKFLRVLKSRVGAKKFDSQMMLKIPKSEDGFFAVDDFEGLFFKGVPEIIERNFKPQLYIGNNLLVSSVAYWDPSSGKNKADGSVITIAYINSEGRFFVINVDYINSFVSNSVDIDEQVDFVINLLKKHFVGVLHVETNGIGKFIPEILKKRFREEALAVEVVGVHNRTSKSIRIVEALEGAISSGFLKFSERFKGSFFFDELKNWSPQNGFRDDGLDAVAGLLLSDSRRIVLLRKNRLPLRKVYKVRKSF